MTPVLSTRAGRALGYSDALRRGGHPRLLGLRPRNLHSDSAAVYSHAYSQPVCCRQASPSLCSFPLNSSQHIFNVTMILISFFLI